MPDKMPYELYISNRCLSCTKLTEYLKKHRINVKTINIDEEKYNLPFSLMILPALIKGKKLIGYGYKDIITRLEH